jgi:hypothetical protein
VRIPYPERISYLWAVVAATLLLGVQVLEHTDKTFAFLCFAYVLITVIAFNMAGGMYRPAGAYIGFTAVLTALIGLATKAYFREPAQSHLQVPVRTMEVYVCGMVALLMAVFVERAIRPSRPLVVRLFPVVSLRSVYLGAALLGIVSNLLYVFTPNVQGLLHFVREIDLLGPFSIVLGVMSTVRSTKGKNSVTPFLLAFIVLLTVEGLAVFSKQALLTPAFCWAIGAGISRYRLKLANLLVLAPCMFILFYYGVPISQVGKSSDHGTDIIQNYNKAKDLFLHFDDTKAQYQADDLDQDSTVTYFDHPQGFLDRLQFLATDDLLIQETDQDGTFGYEPIVEGFENLIPHFLWANKPVPFFGNTYAHSLGLLADDDPMTGVSFGASADAYKEGGFAGVLVMMPLVMMVVFCCISFVVGDVRDHPAAILLVVYVAHDGPEGMMPGAIILILVLSVVMAFGFLSRYIFPLITAAALPPPKLGELVTTID